MNSINRAAVAVSALALALAPAALAHGGGGNGGNGGGNPPAAQHGKGHHKAKKVTAKGTVVSYDATTGMLVVDVTRSNHHNAVSGQTTFDVSKARFTVADTNNDGKTDASDLAVGDKVVVQGAGNPTDGWTARHVVDQTHPKTSDGTDSTDSQDQGTTTP